jgi:hypothetical protein
LRVAELFEHDLLKRPEDALGLGPWDLGAISDSNRELCLGKRQGETPSRLTGAYTHWRN